jgi:hypothetical protein
MDLCVHKQTELAVIIGVILGIVLLLFLFREVFAWFTKTHNILDRLDRIEKGLENNGLITVSDINRV